MTDGLETPEPVVSDVSQSIIELRRTTVRPLRGCVSLRLQEPWLPQAAIFPTLGSTSSTLQEDYLRGSLVGSTASVAEAWFGGPV